MAIRKMMMTMVVVTALGRWMLMKDQLLSTEVVFLISSATSVVGGEGGEAALHMLAVQWSSCQLILQGYFKQDCITRDCLHFYLFASGLVLLHHDVKGLLFVTLGYLWLCD